jgi:hypothetical protein
VSEINDILVANLGAALLRVDRYVVLGLVAGVSALVFFRQPWPASNAAPSPQRVLLVPAGPDATMLVLLGLWFVAGIMAYAAARGAVVITERLAQAPAILDAACTYSSIATSPGYLRVGAALLPVAFVAPILIGMRQKLRAAGVGSGDGIIPLVGLAAAPYLALALTLARFPCG